MTADSNAFAAVQQLSGLTPEEQQYLLTVARGEGFYGLGWGNPSPKTVSDSQSFGLDPMAGVGSKNWGAVQGIASAGSFKHVDYHANGTPYVGIFKKYSSDAEAAADVARILLKPNVKSALASGSLNDAVLAQHANGYFELDPKLYLAAVKKNYDTLVSNLGWPRLLDIKGGMIANHPLVFGSPSSDSARSSSTVLFSPLENVEWQKTLEETQSLLDSTIGPLDGKKC